MCGVHSRRTIYSSPPSQLAESLLRPWRLGAYLPGRRRRTLGLLKCDVSGIAPVPDIDEGRRSGRSKSEWQQLKTTSLASDCMTRWRIKIKITTGQRDQRSKPHCEPYLHIKSIQANHINGSQRSIFDFNMFCSANIEPTISLVVMSGSFLTGNLYNYKRLTARTDDVGRLAGLCAVWNIYGRGNARVSDLDTVDQGRPAAVRTLAADHTE